jgi:ROS/MUCR transcriptional regulator protein
MARLSKPPPPFQTRREVERYFAGKTIECLLCGEQFDRLSPHLRRTHAMAPDAYREQFGLPWSRGLTSAVSHKAIRWTAKTRAQARRRARKNRFFKYSRRARRREVAPYLKLEALAHLGIDPEAYGEKLEKRLRALFKKGYSDRRIAGALHIGASTVNRRTRHWRDRKPKRKARAARARR